MYTNVLFTSNYYFEYGLGIILYNITAYIIILFLIFSIFFLFDIKFFKTLNEFKIVGSLPFITISIVLALLSLAGVPPMFGFSGKFLMFLFFFTNHQYLILFFFSFLNIFMMYFYMQNVRFLVTKKTTSSFMIKNNFIYFDFMLIYYIVVLNFINFFGFLFVEDILIYINHICSFLYLS